MSGTPNQPGTPGTPSNPPSPTDAPTIFPATIGSNEPDPNAVQPAPTEPDPNEQRFAALEAQNAQLLQQNQQFMQTLQFMMNRPATPVAPAPAEPPAFTLDGLPDPVSAPKDFTAQLQERIRQRDTQLTQQLTSNITTQIARGAALDNLYNRFSYQHPELAKRDATLRGAVNVEFNRLQQMGLDPALIAQQNPDSLIANIAARMNQELGIQQQQSGSGTTPTFVPGQPAHGAPMTPASPATPGAPNAARVAGIAGGSGQPRTPTPPPAPKGFVAQLNEQRAKDGLI